MPVPEYSGPNVSTANGVATVFPYDFLILDEEHIAVVVDGVTKTLNTDYTVSGVGSESGGNITFLSAPADQSQVVRDRAVPYVRVAVDWQEGGPFQADTVDLDTDLQEMQIQQLAAGVKRAIKAPRSVSADQVVTEDEWADRAGRGFGFDAVGNLVLLVMQAGTSLVDLAAAAGASMIGFIQSGAGAVLRSVQDKLRDKIHIKDFGGVFDSPSSGAENVIALNNAAVAAASRGILEIEFDAGFYYLDSAPDVFTTGIVLVGKGKRATILVRNYSAGSSTESFLEWDGSEETANSGGMRNIIAYAGLGTTGGVAIKLSGTAADSRAGHMTFASSTVSGEGTWDYGIYSDGSAITTAGSQGIRVVTFLDFEIFNATTKSIYIKNAVNWQFLGVQLFEGLGAAPDVTIDGGGTADSNSTAVYFSGLQCGGSITVQNSNTVHFAASSTIDLTIASTADNGTYIGRVGNAPTNNSTSFGVVYSKSSIGVGLSGIVTATDGILFGTGTDVLSVYDDNTWTPTLTFSTPGDVAVTYGTRNGSYVRIGSLFVANFYIQTSAFTHSTASGNLRITGLPVSANASPTMIYRGSMSFQGITKASYTQFLPHVISNTNYIDFHASGSAQNLSTVGSGDVPSGGSIVLQGVVIFRV